MPQRSSLPASFSPRAFSLAVLVGLALAYAVACSGRATQGIRQNSQTHWLERCDTSADCGTLECSCGICTRECGATGACSSLGASAVCAALSSSNVCGGAVPENTLPGNVCLAGCQGNDDCEGDTTCRDGACVPMAPMASRAVGESCTSAADCESGVCAGEGCGTDQGTCLEANQPCVLLPATEFCGCDGVTRASSCPTFRWEHEGACEGALKADGEACLAATECESGVCQGEGCDESRPGTCGAPACEDIAVTYCSCEGVTIFSNACAGVRYRYVGQCEGEPSEPTSCDTNDDCPSGVCEGEGCGAGQGTCRPTSNFGCTDDLVTYCTCDGMTIGSSGSCPGVRYEYRGQCGDPALPDVESCPSETCESVTLPNGDTVIVPAEHEFEQLQGIDTLVGRMLDAEGDVVFEFDGCGMFGPAVSEDTGEAGEAQNTTFRVLLPEITGGPTHVTFADRLTNLRIEGTVSEAEALRIAQSYTAVGEPCIED